MDAFDNLIFSSNVAVFSILSPSGNCKFVFFLGIKIVRMAISFHSTVGWSIKKVNNYPGNDKQKI